ncbi:MAG: response regulator transcription factor [Fimbriimonadaceae bacterium]|uniref:DNA-binding response regulator n=1 Tax=Candidatus Nitrosymbiomonas proteolyticus TaxID=2608984 RepID=A0A809S305_9BACT|nr:MAG: DNA-binding response regulator [Armatimonadota bacterium]MCK6630960.1 response regulator transcription factor [Fimbriimonadaceae bacterium]BBO22947.1 DNA-binding response regulator [Candidatus Nitrosymbiomonas proteolyticus]MCZ7579718.1 response regulator transcription factor [Fimbriimonadaceae bacterium]NUM38203.1 response regulator transcription factor [Armatimonadota bacterium]
MSSRVRVVVADDEVAYRNALQRTLDLMPDCEVVAMCKDGQEALDACLAETPDVLLTDVNMPRMSGVELAAKLSAESPEIKIVVLTVQEDDETVYDAFRAGALGYLLKSSTPQDVIEAIRLAAKGEAKITPKIAAKVVADFRRVREIDPPDDTELYVLSDREQEILDLIAEGMRNKEIANKLCIAEKTVKNHVSNILKALHVNSRTEAAMKAVRSRMGGREG